MALPEQPSTPLKSRPRHQASLILSKPRAMDKTAPLSTFNPFSPQKNKRTHRETVTKVAESRPSPFASPLTTKMKPSLPSRSYSPDPFPNLKATTEPASLLSFSPTPPPPVPMTAVSRARKRLRGEPVSPSPNKEKRRRIRSQTTLPFSMDDANPFSSDEDDKMNSSFVTDSPVKAPSGGKSFTLLFNEAKVPSSGFLPKSKAPVAQNKSSGRLFEDMSTALPSSAGGMDEDIDWDMDKEESNAKPPRFRLTISKGKSAPLRANNDIEMEASEISVKATLIDQLNSQNPSPILTKARGKAKASVGRKKIAPALSLNDDDDDSDEMPNIKIIDPLRTRLRTQPSGEEEVEHNATFDSDHVLDSSHRAAPSGHGMGRIEVDLPDKLRRVLALESTESKARDSQEERIAMGLIYGRRASHYDPAKGGEIWDAGEDVDGDVETGQPTWDEDDWEGEPVPWEVGEL